MMREVAVRSELSGSGRGISAEYVRLDPGGERAGRAPFCSDCGGIFALFEPGSTLVGLGALSEPKGTPGRV